MQSLYFVLAALHMVAFVVIGILWTAYTLGLTSIEKKRPLGDGRGNRGNADDGRRRTGEIPPGTISAHESAFF
jgi:hypothetical protein